MDDRRAQRARFSLRAAGLCTLLAGTLAGPGRSAQPTPAPRPLPEFESRQAMVPTRDGVRLNTRIFVPREPGEALPILLVRTPYGVAGAEGRLRQSLRELAVAGYIFAFQDIRGRYDSEGQFVMLRPPRKAGEPGAIDEGTDTYDTIEWLLRNVPGHNGRVGMLGVSYDGWLTAMALVDPHPALQAASPQAPVADMFLGDDFHHNGAFRLSYGFEYVALMETGKTNSLFKFDTWDTYDWYLRLGALSRVDERHFRGQRPTWRDFVEHPNYDAFWQRQAAPQYLTRCRVPTLTVGGWWDQEDFYGPLRIYDALEKEDHAGRSFLVLGPWNHGGWGGEGRSLGPIGFGSATGEYFRQQVQAPWFAHYLKGAPAPEQPEALTFETGANAWRRHDRWPPRAERRSLYLGAAGAAGFAPPRRGGSGFDEYVSDPERPVPYRPRPIPATYADPSWSTWLVGDQRFVHRRPDVLSWETEPLAEELVLAGEVGAELFASTSGTDSDWIVKLIDVYPDGDVAEPKLGGYQLMIASEVLRGRFRKSFEHPEPVRPGEVNRYGFSLHAVNHRFRKGHRLMAQVQSTWFPLIDRNPQRYVDSIFKARESDYRRATQRVYRTPRYPSRLELPVVGP